MSSAASHISRAKYVGEAVRLCPCIHTLAIPQLQTRGVGGGTEDGSRRLEKQAN